MRLSTSTFPVRLRDPFAKLTKQREAGDRQQRLRHLAFFQDFRRQTGKAGIGRDALAENLADGQARFLKGTRHESIYLASCCRIRRYSLSLAS